MDHYYKRGRLKSAGACPGNDLYLLPAKGFKKMDLSHYINHSDQPNIRSLSDGDFFESLSEIKSGEELLIDYGTIVEDAN